MNKNNKFSKDWLFLLLIIISGGILLNFFPEKIGPVFSNSKKYFLEMAIIFPAVLIIMGLFKVWISKDMVVKYLGKTSGIKGILIAVALGATPTGPLYVAFPLASTMIEKKARIMNVVVFLSAWACIKIPQEMIEIQFLGFEFMIIRLIFTIILVSLIGFIIEKIIKKSEIKTPSNTQEEKGEEQ